MSTSALAASTTPPSMTTVLRPLITRLSNEYGLSAALLILPPVLALYGMTLSSGKWGYVLLVHGVATAVVLLLTGGLHRANVQITPEGFIETGLFGAAVSTPRDDIDYVLILSVSDGNSSRVHDQLFVLDHSGRTRLRLRGQFWGSETLRTVASAYDLAVVRVDTPKVMADVRADHASKLYWHERHPMLRGLLFAIGVFVIIGPVLWFCQQLI